MPHRSEELRKTAAECLALAQSTLDVKTRSALLAMAQKLHDMANSPAPAAINFDSIVQGFNDQQMGGPRRFDDLIRQQQQPQPKKDEEKG